MRRLSALVLVVAVAACTGDGDRQRGATCPVERTLVADTTGLVLGARVEPIAIGTDVQCTFRGGDGITSVSLTTWSGADAFMQLLGDVERIDVAFADEARWSDTTSTLYAAVGDRGVTVQVIDVVDAIDDPQGVAVELAAAALA